MIYSNFFSRDPKLVPLFERLQKEEKKIFLITNSPFETVDAGMTYMMGSQWRDFFDVVVVQVAHLPLSNIPKIVSFKAGKPHFFMNLSQPFRELDIDRFAELESEFSKHNRNHIAPNNVNFILFFDNFYQRRVPLGTCEQSRKGEDLCWGDYWKLPGTNWLEGRF